MKLGPYLTQVTKINAKCIKDLENNPESIEDTGDNTGRTLQEMDLRGVFNKLTTGKDNKKGYIKLIGPVQQKKPMLKLKI